MLHVNEKCESGQIVSEIYGQSDKVCCFTTEDSGLRWEYYENNGKIPKDMMRAVTIFDSCVHSIKTTIPLELRKPYYENAAKCLFSALDLNDSQKIDENFLTIRNALKSIQYAPCYYASSGVSCALILGITLLLLARFNIDSKLNEYFYAVLLGFIGSIVSILQRCSKIWSSLEISVMNIILQGSARALIGGIFGLSIILFVKGNIVAGFLNNTGESLYAVSFLAGCSERLIPEISSNLERRLSNE